MVLHSYKLKCIVLNFDFSYKCFSALLHSHYNGDNYISVSGYFMIISECLFVVVLFCFLLIRNLLSHSSRSLKSKVLVGLVSSEGCERESVPCAFLA